MPQPSPIFRAPMRSRQLEIPPGVGAAHGLRQELCGIGGALDPPPDTPEEAVAATADRDGERAARRLARFAAVPDGSFVWTRDDRDRYHLGRLAGPWRYDASPEATAVGLHHVRPTAWSPATWTEDEVPVAVAATFGRGGRNFQRTHDAEAERETAALWEQTVTNP